MIKEHCFTDEWLEKFKNKRTTGELTKSFWKR